MEYRLSEKELKDLMHRSWLNAKKFYSGKTDEYFYDYFESEKKQLPIYDVVSSKILIDRKFLLELMTKAIKEGFNTYEIVESGLESFDADAMARWMISKYL